MGRVSEAVGRRYGGPLPYLRAAPRRRSPLHWGRALSLVLLVVGVLLLAVLVWLLFATLSWHRIDRTVLRDLSRNYLGAWVNSWLKGAGGGG